MILGNQGLSKKFKTKMEQWDEDGILPIDYLEKVATIMASTVLYF
jgi:hypothetical protein